MNRLTILFFSILLIKSYSSIDIVNIYSSYLNPKICKSPANDINCYYEINIWYYVPSDINKIYFMIPSDDNSSGAKLYISNLGNNELQNMILIEKNSESYYEIEREKNKLYVIFSELQNENKKISIRHFYTDDKNSNKNPKTLQLSYYKNFPIEIQSLSAPKLSLSFYDYENSPDKIYFISNNNYYIYYINSNSSSINYNTQNLQYFDNLNINNNYDDYKIYKKGDYYYLISKMIFIKIEKTDDLLVLTDFSSDNEKFEESGIQNDANVNSIEQIEYSNGEIMHLYFRYSNKKICSVEKGCSQYNSMRYISFYYNGECFIAINVNEIFRCSFRPNDASEMEFIMGNKINNRFVEDEEHSIIQIRVFPLDETNNYFLLCSVTSGYNLFCVIFNYNSIENDLKTKNTIKIFGDTTDIKLINVFPYRSNKISDNNLIVIVSKNKYSILDINNNISITGIQDFKFDINKDLSFYDLGNNKFLLAYSTGSNNIQLNIGLEMGTIPKRKKVLKILEEFQEFLEIDFNELFDENEKLSNENYKVIFIKPIFESKDNNFNSDDIKFFYNDKTTDLLFIDSNEPEYEINSNEKLFIKLLNYSFNIYINYTIIGEQFASKNLLKIMNLPKCNKFCSTCNYENAQISDDDNHYCDICNNDYEYFFPMENNGISFNNCYINCPSQSLYTISGEKECYKNCPSKAPYYIASLYQCLSNCLEGYYQYENSYECNDICPEIYFIDDKNKKCTSVCPEGYYGDEDSRKCVEECPNDFYKNNVNHLCVENCPNDLLTDNKNKMCVNNCKENLFEDSENNNCVENCPENYYKDKLNHKCVLKCPDGYYEDNDYYICLQKCKEGYKRDIKTDICILISNEEDPQIKYISYDNNNECTESILENYLSLIDYSIELYQCNDLKIQIFSGNKDSMERSKEISKKYNMLFLDINNCLDFIINNSNDINSKDELMIIMIENQSNHSLTNNFNLYVYDIYNNSINLQLCEQNNIPISISKNIVLNDTEIDLIKYYKDEYSFDITNSKEDCFNDICTIMQTEEGLDISMEYRRTKIFKDNNICGDNVEYEINYKESMIKCFIYDYNEINDSSDNNKLLNENKNFITELSNSNVNIIKCYNLVFDFPKAIKNISNWIIICLFIIKCLFFVLYLFTTITSIETFLGYWQLFKDGTEANQIQNINNNNAIQTLQTENNESSTKRKIIIKNRYKDEEDTNKKNALESLSTLVKSISIQKNSLQKEINNEAAPPKKKKKWDKSLDEDSKKKINKKDEKEFIFEKIDKINYTKYIDKEDDVISEGCYPVVVIDSKVALKKQEEEKRRKEEEKRKEEEEKRKKEEEERKIREKEKKEKEEEERRKIEEEKKKREEKEKKKKMKEEQKRKKEEEKRKKEEDKKRKEEEIKKKEEIKRKQEEDKKRKEEEIKKREEEKNKKIEEQKKKIREEKNEEEVKRKRMEEEKQKRIQEMKKKKEEDDKRWKMELEKREIMMDKMKKQKAQEIKKRMKEIYERRNYGFEEENNVGFLKKMEQLEKELDNNKKNKNIKKNILNVEEKEEDITINKDNITIKKKKRKNDEKDDKKEDIESKVIIKEESIDNSQEENEEDDDEEEEEEEKEDTKKSEKVKESSNDNKEKPDNEIKNIKIEDSLNKEENESKSNEEDDRNKEESENVDKINEKENITDKHEETKEKNDNESNSIKREEKSNEEDNSDKEEESEENTDNVKNSSNNEEKNKEEESEEKSDNKKDSLNKRYLNTKDNNNEEEKLEKNSKNKVTYMSEEDDNEQKSNNKNKKNKKDDDGEVEKDNDIHIEIKDYNGDLDDEIINYKSPVQKERIKSSKSKKGFLDEKEEMNNNIGKKEENKKNSVKLLKKRNIDYYLKSREYNSSYYRINYLSYEEALKFDKRKYFQIYQFYIINFEIILNLIFNPNYLEIFYIKIIFLLYIIEIEGLFNALLYRDKYINNVYDNNGKYNFFYNLPKSLLSVVIAYIIDILLFQLITSRNKFQEVIEHSNPHNFQNEVNDTIKCLKRKIAIFLIISFIIGVFSWYYCCIFCALYQYNSKFWLISLLISLIIHFILPFILCFIPTTLKYCAFKKKSEKTYKLNSYLEKFLL